MPQMTIPPIPATTRASARFRKRQIIHLSTVVPLWVRGWWQEEANRRGMSLAQVVCEALRKIAEERGAQPHDELEIEPNVELDLKT